MRMFLERREVALRFLIGRGAEGRPGRHQAPAAIEQVRTVVRCDRLVAEGVGQSHLGDLGWDARALSRPIAEARPKSVRCRVALAHPP